MTKTNTSSTRTTAPAVSGNDTKAKIAAIQAQMKALRAQAKAEREASKGEREADSIAVAKKYIAIFTERKARLLKKAAKCDELIKKLSDRLAKAKVA